MSDRRKRLSAAKSICDIEVGDYVRRSLGSRKVGLVEEVHDGGYCWVRWSPDLKSYLPLAAVRKVHPGGSDFDVRKT